MLHNANLLIITLLLLFLAKVTQFVINYYLLFVVVTHFIITNMLQSYNKKFDKSVKKDYVYLQTGIQFYRRHFTFDNLLFFMQFAFSKINNNFFFQQHFVIKKMSALIIVCTQIKMKNIFERNVTIKINIDRRGCK